MTLLREGKKVTNLANHSISLHTDREDISTFAMDTVEAWPPETQWDNGQPLVSHE